MSEFFFAGITPRKNVTSGPGGMNRMDFIENGTSYIKNCDGEKCPESVVGVNFFFAGATARKKRDAGTGRSESDGFFYENGALYGKKCDGEKCSESVVGVKKIFAGPTSRKNVTREPRGVNQKDFFTKTGVQWRKMFRIGGRYQNFFCRSNDTEKREVGTGWRELEGFFTEAGRSMAKSEMVKNA